MPRRRVARGQRSLQLPVVSTDARKKEVAARAPNQQPEEGTSLGMEPYVSIGLLTRQLAQDRAYRVAGPINQQQQRQHDTEGNAMQDAQRELPGDDDRGDGELRTTAGEQVAQIAGLGEVKHRGDDDGSERRMRHATEQ